MRLLDETEMLYPENKMLVSFLETLIWSENNIAGEPLDTQFNIQDIDQGCADLLKKVCKEFLKRVGDYTQLEHDYTQLGHDFYLTIAGHGAGFWVGDWPINGDKLTSICEEYIQSIYVFEYNNTIFVDIYYNLNK